MILKTSKIKYVQKLKNGYDFKENVRVSYVTLIDFLLQNDFIRDKAYTTLFIKKKKCNQDFLIIQIYVNTIIFNSIHENLCKDFFELMQSEFQMSMRRELMFFL